MTTKIGVFGGTFNPVHNGHINSAKTVKETLGLSKMIIVPNAQNPLKQKVDRPSPEERLKMVQLAFENVGGSSNGYYVHDFEVLRGQESYTVDTLSYLQTEYLDSKLFFIVGADQVEDFPKWKRHEEILDIATLVVTSRPGFDLSAVKNSYQFVELKDKDIAATDLRSLLANNKDVSEFLPNNVIEYIKRNEFYLKEEL